MQEEEEEGGCYSQSHCVSIDKQTVKEEVKVKKAYTLKHTSVCRLAEKSLSPLV